MNQGELKEIERRRLGHWNIDGLPELLMGTICTVWGGLWLIVTALSTRDMPYTAFWLVLPPVFAGSGFFGGRMLQLLKERVTYPRVGYARNGRLLILAVISLGLGIWVWRTEAEMAGRSWGALWLGLPALVLGALRLRRFLGENPKAAETEA